ncbi:MAG: glycosyltransferase family 4 protein [Myxococcales bacterium FL481]|nr:MAG: glycosyltransferase family 4 protein [Myxococcales bacterium FL481]
MDPQPAPRCPDDTPHNEHGAAAPSPLKIAVFCPSLRVGGGLAVGKNLVEALIRRQSARTKLGESFRFIVPSGVGYESLAERSPGTDFRFCPRPRYGVVSRMWWDQFEAAAEIDDYNADAILGLGNFGFRSPKAPQVMMVQNPNLCYPPVYPRLSGERALIAVQKLALRWRLRGTSALLTQTDVMSARIRKAYGFPGPTHTVSKAVSRDVADPNPARFQREFADCKHRGGFAFLCVSRYYLHKNLELVVDAFARERESLQKIEVFLTISPDDDPRARALLNRIESLGLSRQIRTLGPIDSRDLSSIYYQADAVLLPTRLESFSGNYIEAMKFARPIVTTDLDFAREVCGEAALYFTDRDPASLARSLLSLANDSALRRRLVAAGTRRLEGFPSNWDTIAGRVMDAVRSQISGG